MSVQPPIIASSGAVHGAPLAVGVLEASFARVLDVARDAFVIASSQEMGLHSEAPERGTAAG